MDENWNLISWLKLMGYDGEIPESLGNICNSSTSLIWIQLMQNAKPKQEADNLRNNIIIHRLKSTILNEHSDQYSYPLKEIDFYIKKQTLETKLHNLKNIVHEKKHKLYNLSQHNKIKYIALEKLTSNIKEIEQREYLLRKKYEALESNIQETEETLRCAKNLTPVEQEENPSTYDITETLQKCSEKLEKLLHNVPLPNKFTSTQKPVRLHSSARKQLKGPSNFEKLLVMSEQKNSRKPPILKRTRSNTLVEQDDKENIGVQKKISTVLFSDRNQPMKQNKRESLGILHESYMRENNDLNFLTCELEEVFLSSLTPGKKNTSSPDFTKPGRTNIDMDVISCDHLGISVLSQSNDQYSSKEGLRLEALYNNEFVINSLMPLLYNHNRPIIWSTIQALNGNLNLDITKNIMFSFEQKNRYWQFNQSDIAKLQFRHVQTELQTLKLKIFIKELSNTIDRKKRQIYAAVAKMDMSPDDMDSFERFLENQLIHVGLDSILAEMKKEINSATKSVDSSDLQTIFRTTTQIKDYIIIKINSIKHYINIINETLVSTISTKEQTMACVRKLGPFVEDLSWSVLLTENVCSNEIKLLENFPLEYNRRCIYTNSRIYHRDIAQNIPKNIDFDSDSINLLTSVLGSPFSPPEAVLLNMLKSKIKLHALTSLQTFHLNIIEKQYIFKELQAQENYVQYALDKLSSLIYSTTSNKTLATTELMKKIVEIWVEMPIKQFISTEKTLKGKNYMFYEKQYDSFYNNF